MLFPLSAQFSRSVVSDSLRPHGLQHTRPACPSPTPRVYSNSCPLSQWCHPIFSSSVVPFSSHLQSFPASGSFQMSQFFASSGQSIGVSVLLQLFLFKKKNTIILTLYLLLLLVAYNYWVVGIALAFSQAFCTFTHLLLTTPSICAYKLLLQLCPMNLWTIAHQAPLSMGFCRQEYTGVVAMPSSRGSCWPRDQTHISYVYLHWQMGSLERLLESPVQGIFPTQGSNPGLLNCRQILYHLSHQGSPWILEWVAYPFSRGSSHSRNLTRVSCIAGRFFTSWATHKATLNLPTF